MIWKIGVWPIKLGARNLLKSIHDKQFVYHYINKVVYCKIKYQEKSFKRPFITYLLIFQALKWLIFNVSYVKN